MWAGDLLDLMGNFGCGVGCGDVGLLDLVFCLVIMVGAVAYALLSFGFGRVGCCDFYVWFDWLRWVFCLIW